jgi:hypothetical protein
MEMDAWQPAQIQAMMFGGNTAFLTAIQGAGFTGQLLEIRRSVPSSEIKKQYMAQLDGLACHIIASKYNTGVATCLRGRLEITKCGNAVESLPDIPQLDPADLVRFRQHGMHICKYFFPLPLWERLCNSPHIGPCRDTHGALFFTVRIVEVTVEKGSGMYLLKVCV